MSVPAFFRRLAHSAGRLDASRPYIDMFDSVTPSVLPTGGSYAYLGYVGGLWPTYHELEQRFPGHRLVDMAVFASENATGLDIENGDATIEDAPGWFERQVARGVYRPVMYIQASNMKALEQQMAGEHIARASYRLLSAHYGLKPHLCGPGACGYGLSEADGTQWTSTAFGLNLDQSLLLPDFFDPRPAPVPAPVPAVDWQESMMNRLPTLKQGDVDKPGEVPWVRLMQGDIVAQGHAHKIEAAYDLQPDGDFGLKTANALLSIQTYFGLKGDRECGPRTWPALVTGHP